MSFPSEGTACVCRLPCYTTLNLLDQRWKNDDRDWFERNQQRLHRAGMPFPGEVDKKMAETPAGHALIMLVRHVEPRSRLRAAFCLNADLLPLPDDKGVAHSRSPCSARRRRPTARRSTP